MITRHDGFVGAVIFLGSMVLSGCGTTAHPVASAPRHHSHTVKTSPTTHPSQPAAARTSPPSLSTAGQIADRPGQTFRARLYQLDLILKPRTRVSVYLPGHLNGLRENPSMFYRTSQGSYRVLFGSPPTLNALPMASGCASQTLGAVWGIPISDQRLLTTLFHTCIPLPFYLQLPTSSAQTTVPLTPMVSGTLYVTPNEPGYEDIVWRQDGWTLIDTGYVGTNNAKLLSLARVTAADLSRTRRERPLPGRHGAVVFVYGAPDAPSEATFQLGRAQYVIYANGYEALAWAQQMTDRTVYVKKSSAGG